MSIHKRHVWVVVGIGAVVLVLAVGFREGILGKRTKDHLTKEVAGRQTAAHTEAAHARDILNPDTGDVKQTTPAASEGDEPLGSPPSSSARPRVALTLRQETARRPANDVEETDYSQYDTDPAWGIKVEQVGIPRPEPATRRTSLQPTESDRRRMRELEREREEAVAKGLLHGEPRAGYVRRAFDDGRDVVYVEPGFLSRFDSIAEEFLTINRRSMQPDPGTSYAITPSLGRRLTDGATVEYYRRRDGALIRSVKKPDGSVRRWVIGHTDLSQYAQQLSPPTQGRMWRDE